MNNLIKEMQNLVKKEKLDNPNLFFGDYGTFEEIPLFSRWSHVDFLKKYNFDERNKTLLKQAIILTNEAILNATQVKNLDYDEYFICVSVISWDYIDELGCISPNIFVSKRRSWILPLLGLKTFESPEINMIEKYLCDLRISKKTVYVSKSYGNDDDRIYIVDDFFLKKTEEQS